MEAYRVSLIGHSQIYDFVREGKRLEQLIYELMYIHKHVEFYIGRNGDFDTLATDTIRRIQHNLFGNLNFSLVLVSECCIESGKRCEQYYDKVIHPISSDTHQKAEVTERDRWLVDNSELLIAYVEDGRKDDAYNALKYAEEQGVENINLVTMGNFFSILNESSCVIYKFP